MRSNIDESTERIDRYFVPLSIRYTLPIYNRNIKNNWKFSAVLLSLKSHNEKTLSMHWRFSMNTPDTGTAPDFLPSNTWQSIDPTNHTGSLVVLLENILYVYFERNQWLWRHLFRWSTDILMTTDVKKERKKKKE